MHTEAGRAERGGGWCTFRSKHHSLRSPAHLVNGVVTETPSSLSSCPVFTEGGSCQALIQVCASPHLKGIGAELRVIHKLQSCAH